MDSLQYGAGWTSQWLITKRHHECHRCRRNPIAEVVILVGDDVLVIAESTDRTGRALVQHRYGPGAEYRIWEGPTFEGRLPRNYHQSLQPAATGQECNICFHPLNAIYNTCCSVKVCRDCIRRWSRSNCPGGCGAEYRYQCV